MPGGARLRDSRAETVVRRIPIEQDATSGREIEHLERVGARLSSVLALELCRSFGWPRVRDVHP